jgi:ABC-type antimicrobial peptide transport system permease subunit
MNPDLAIESLQSVDSLIDDELDGQIFVARLSGFFAGLALVLACVGLYGITAYSVAVRTRELGVRMALGAKPSDVLTLVLRDALVVVAIGIAIGVPAAIGGSRLLRSMLFEVTSYDLRSLSLSLVALMLVGFLASYVPARRASKVDPMVSLRYE